MTGSRSLHGITFVLLVVGLLAACASGATSSALSLASATPAAKPSEPAPPPVASVAGGSGSTSSSPPSPPVTGSPNMRLTSTAFADGGAIPRKYSCDGEDVSPPLAWDGVPTEAKALVLVVDDPDARGFVHWVVFDLPATPTGQLAEGASATEADLRQGTNSFGKVGWGGPCPPSGTHHYRFRLLAIREPIGLNGAPTADQVLAAARGRTVGEATLTGLYHR